MKSSRLPATEDLRVFSVVAQKESLSSAAEELSVSIAYVSKRIAVLEAELGTRLLHRSPRGVVLSQAGHLILEKTRTILGGIEELVDDVALVKGSPRGNLRISSSFGFGRRWVAPTLTSLAERYPELSVRLDLFDRIVDVTREGFDLDVRIGDEHPEQLIARKLATNYRVLCASPTYLEAHGCPESLRDLTRHACLPIKERDHPIGVWRLTSTNEVHTIKVDGPMSTNDGEVAVRWALDGKGIVLRSLWDVRPLLDHGALVRILPGVTQPASIWALYPERLANSGKVAVCVDFLAAAFRPLGEKAEAEARPG